MKTDFFSILLAGSLFTGAASGASIFSSSFDAHGSADGATSFSGLTWVTNGVTIASDTLALSAGEVQTSGAPENADRLAVARNIDTAGPWSIEIAFSTVTSTVVADFTFDYQFISGGGANQGAPHPGSGVVNVALLDGAGAVTLSEVTLPALGDETAASNSGTGIVADLPDFALVAGTDYVLRFTVSSEATSGNNFALDTVSLNSLVIPEPSTAALALVAGLGLLRRRRLLVAQ
ncbi:hypothetical protein [Roseibacillus ishigakijimensis]|uniref:PEP-CTERM protein-sorting domain-containing protein n=1 Tax=Roseibacillus ishigakijimensis TaxID=454146 RepID=A0A934RN51_9BACT|nr:hypothetical protein [Roseibacillus ishigakijimensis]MBK1832722.1 hypothetical protein [Roseibacillus ishigakijimensis]